MSDSLVRVGPTVRKGSASSPTNSGASLDALMPSCSVLIASSLRPAAHSAAAMLRYGAGQPGASAIASRKLAIATSVRLRFASASLLSCAPRSFWKLGDDLIKTSDGLFRALLRKIEVNECGHRFDRTGRHRRARSKAARAASGLLSASSMTQIVARSSVARRPAPIRLCGAQP